MDATLALELADWRRTVAVLYERVRSGSGEAAWRTWREGRERLYREHPQSPVPAERRSSYAFACFPYDATMRTVALMVSTPPRHREGDGEVPGMTQVGTLQFTLGGTEHELGAFWLDGYAGGLLVPFADASSGTETYGGGRYALDTAKGADLGTDGGRVLLDFNYAYAPSCAHDPRWRCPLAPASNRIDIPVRAGEIGP